MELTCETIASACRPSGLASKAMLLPVSRVQGTMKCVLIEYIFTHPAGLYFVSGSALSSRYAAVARTSSINLFSWLVRRAQSAGSCMIVSCLGPPHSASRFASSRPSQGGHTDSASVGSVMFAEPYKYVCNQGSDYHSVESLSFTLISDSSEK